MSSTPYNVDNDISTLCSTALRPHLLTGIVLRLLTRHFSTKKGIQDPALKDYIWNPDERQSKILIVPVWRWLTQNIQQRPAIVVKRNALRQRQLGLGDGQSIISGPSTTSVPADSVSTSQVAMVGSHTVFAVARAAAQVDVLSAEIATRLIQYQQAIQAEFGFNRFRVAEVGAISKLEEASETFVVPVTVAYTYVEAWSVWTEAPYLKRITIGTDV